ncbi:hypothetical protein PS900_04191 [Pseudomonas fluorescens]|uniref:O-antigen ligase domain-containing protein n=1 Tax=Pseudomonas fluorescens TaxID=294 RepID=A0A8H2RRD8_PSEFL|nr:hypothetical protein [Pseudomonas fluorescens]VVP27711.1 hypothetical protein PS900_04191 [Pseudomonas fluorescens]
MNNTYSKAPTLCLIYIALIFIPAELYWSVGEIRLEPYRVFLILASLVLLPKIIKHQYDKKEIALLIYCGLCAISFIYVHGGKGIQSSLILLLEVFVSYFLGLSIKANIQALKKCISLLMVLFLILAPFGVAEAFDGYRFFHVLFANIAGNFTLDNLGESYFRHGIHRASTVFAHPILYSVIAIMYFSLLFRLYSPVIMLLFSIGIITAAVTSVTSAGLLMIALTLGLYLLQRSKAYIPNIYKLFLWFIAIAYISISMASNRGPVQILIQMLSLNSETAYTRYLQWQFASEDISNHPFFGIGFNEWTRPFWLPPSIDSYWLVTVLQNGVLALVALSVFFICSLKQYWQRFHETNEWLYFCFFCSISAFVLAAFTVDFFDRAQFILFLTMGFYNSFVSKAPPSKRLGTR